MADSILLASFGSEPLTAYRIFLKNGFILSTVARNFVVSVILEASNGGRDCIDL